MLILFSILATQSKATKSGWSYKAVSQQQVRAWKIFVPKKEGFKIRKLYVSWVPSNASPSKRGFRVFEADEFGPKSTSVKIIIAKNQGLHNGRPFLEYIRYEGFLPGQLTVGDSFFYREKAGYSFLLMGKSLTPREVNQFMNN